jgi:ABC-type transport system involved in multi-copper enzyme maturation permease subunit
MRPILVIAAVTVREAVRRRLIAAFVAITLGLVALSAWGFDKLAHNSRITSGEANAALPQAFILFMFMFSFVVALSASAMASPSISSEIESGVLLTVVTRPVSRSQILLGKWLGLAAVLLAYAVAVCGLEVGVVDAVSGFVPPNPVAVGCYLFAEGAILLSVAMLLSTRLSTLAAGVVCIAVFGTAWLAGVVGSIGTALHISSMQTVGRVARYVLPTDGLWRGAIYYLEPQSFVSQRLANSPDSGNPFFSQVPPGWGYLSWVGVWFLVVMVASLVSFRRREL